MDASVATLSLTKLVRQFILGAGIMGFMGLLDIESHSLVLYQPVNETNHGYPDFSGGNGQIIQISVVALVPLQSSVKPELGTNITKQQLYNNEFYSSTLFGIIILSECT